MERKKWKRADQAVYDVKEQGRVGFEIFWTKDSFPF